MFYLGIDVSKNKLDLALIQDGSGLQTPKRKVLANGQEGFSKLLVWLHRRTEGQVHACMEATGTYYEDLATFLVNSGVEVSVVNPACIANYARSSSVRNKTDSVDALVIADYCRAKHPKPWTPPSPEAKELRELVRRLSTLEQTKQDEENRLSSGISSPAVVRSVERTIRFISDQIKELERLIEQHINSHPNLKEDRDLLVTIPGIGDKTAAIILGELPNASNFDNAKQAAAYAGLSPREYRSGSSVRGRTRLCKVGNSRLRRALYFPAVVACIHNPIVKDLYQRLLRAGKSKMCALGAAMRKLLHIAFGVLRRRQPFAALGENLA
ncbi:MAG TPA: IS110 family transposase [Armatimonadota bacterium]|nr:IS110 family transposase [Armatimonadota bacterium]